MSEKATPKQANYTDMAVTAIAVGLAVVFGMLAAMSALGKISYAEPTTFIMIAILSLTGPIGFYQNAKAMRIAGIEEQFPAFLRDVAESGRFGMTLAAAISKAAKGRYGKLTPEIQKMAAQIGWGVSATNALRMFAERVDTPLIKRCVSVIVKASEAGGDVADVLTTVSNDAREYQILLKERSMQMSIYIAIIYVAFFVFMATIAIMNFTFIPEMIKAGGGASSSGGKGGSMIQTASIGAIKEIYTYALIVHATGDGVLAGVIDTGKISNGLRHSFIMVLVTLIVFGIMT